MNLREFHTEYRDLLPAAFQELGSVKLDSTQVSEAEKVEQFVKDWKPHQGWLSRQSAVQVMRSPNDMLAPGKGHVTAAEFSGSGGSLHIRQKAGGWVVTEVTEGAGDDVIVEPLTFVADKWLVTDKTGLLYHRYWVLDQDDCPKQVFAGFRGFTSLERNPNG